MHGDVIEAIAVNHDRERIAERRGGREYIALDESSCLHAVLR